MSIYNWPSWLETIAYPAPGVGDLQDLRFSVGVGEGGQWVGFVNTGWFYLDNLEQYNYALVGTQEVTAAPGSGVFTEDISFRPSWGPIILTGTASGQFYQHHNTYQPGKVVDWTSAGEGLYYTTIPGSTFVTGVRDLSLLPLGAVSGTGSVLSEKLFWYDQTGGRIWIRPKNTSPINVFLDYLEISPRLRFRELVIVEDGMIRPSYSNIEDIHLIRGHQLEYQAGPSNSLLTHSLTGVADGDWVVLEYNIRKSYIVLNHRTVEYYTSADSGDDLRLNFETSLPDLIQSVDIQHPQAEGLNLNPLYSNAYRTGYLYHTNLAQPASSYWSVGNVQVELDKDWVCGLWGEPFTVSVLITDIQGLPVPHYPLQLVMSEGASAFGLVPSTNTTDGRGELHFLAVSPSGASSFNVWTICAAVTGHASGTVLSQQTAIPSGIFFGGSTEVLVSKGYTPRRYRKLFVKNVSLDGIPKPLSTLILKSEKASAFEYRNNLSNNILSLQQGNSALNVDGIAGMSIYDQIGYLPQPGDRLVGFTQNFFPSQSKFWRTEE